ncbi:unnamed protein product [Rotaria sp. Silwood2]|nr:unnamed protein product [Rotaria sp. Silwood2]
MCDECKKYFCVKHFDQHRQQLSTKFDVEIVRTHDELLDQISRVNQPNTSGSRLFGEIDRWETETYEKVHKAAEKARHQLTQLLTEGKDTLKKDFGIMTKEIRNRRKELNFDENDIERLQQKLNQIEILVNRLVRSTETNAAIVTNDQINWNRVIYVESNHARMDRWKTETYEKVHKAAEKARHQLTQLLTEGKDTLKKDFGIKTKEIRDRRKELNFDENDIERLQQKLNQIEILVNRFVRSTETNVVIVTNDQINWNRVIYIENSHASMTSLRSSSVDIHPNAKWKQTGVTVAGGNEEGNGINQLNCSWGLYVDDEQTAYVADESNHRIIEWKSGATNGRIVAGGKENVANRKCSKNPVVSTAIISIGFMTRIQMDLIGLRTRPDKDFQWILHCRDHYSKYSWAFAIKTKEAQFIADHLITLFYQFGPSRGVDTTPYEIVCGQKPRLGFDLWESIDEQGIINEEDLPPAILEQLMKDKTSMSTTYDVSNTDAVSQQHSISSTITKPDASTADSMPESAASSDIINDVCTQAVDSTYSSNEETDEITQHANEVASDNITSANSAHLVIRRRATEKYLSKANKRIKVYNEFIEEFSSDCSIGDFVGIKIDRTNTDPKILPVIVFKKRRDKIKVACEYDIIDT